VHDEVWIGGRLFQSIELPHEGNTYAHGGCRQHHRTNGSAKMAALSTRRRPAHACGQGTYRQGKFHLLTCVWVLGPQPHFQVQKPGGVNVFAGLLTAHYWQRESPAALDGRQAQSLLAGVGLFAVIQAARKPGSSTR
jgi:hypothetical protein